SIARGADSLLFFRWRTCRFGAEEYWCGILDHDNVPRRRYEEVKQLGEELKAVGPEILGTHVHVDVGIACADVDVYDAHDTMSLGLPSPKEVARELHAYLLEEGYAVGCVHPSDDLSDLKLYVIPHWALFHPNWVPNLTTYVENGGLLVIGARTATKSWYNNVVAQTPPGVLSQLARVQVEEYGRQNAPDKRPLTLRFYPGTERVHTKHWYEQVSGLPGTKTLARWSHRSPSGSGRHLNLKTAITLRSLGEGAVVYVGTYLNAELMAALMARLKEQREDLAPLWAAPEGVQVVLREGAGKRLWFFINNNDLGVSLHDVPEGTELIRGKSGEKRVFLNRYGVAIIKEEV
ncbi:MAG: beta-galactosidase, partial [Anaerolineae bacterium]